MIGRTQQQKLIRHDISRRYAPTHLSYKELQKETLCEIQLSSRTFLVKLLYFRFRATNSRLKNKKLHFESLTRWLHFYFLTFELRT